MLTLEVSSLSIHYLSIGPHAGEIWTKLYGPNYPKFSAFSQKMINHFLQSIDAIMEDLYFCDWNNSLVLNY